ncbi:hypothetical protein [Clostridium tyrobutyricum]|uniref:hypothetical protein n=1 Tax=Clostridium tyrobutyricum TaxID=1519 RepID=UPI00031017D1|nr:hypothetical protein [Clostridium tyrobutyricum]
MGEEVSNKEKCFMYFSGHDDKDRDELIADAARKFKITNMSAQTYYYAWKKEYMDGAIQGVNHNPRDKGKHKIVKKQENLTDEIVAEKVKSKENVMEKVPEVKKDERLTEEEINELCENTEYTKQKPKKLLKIALLQGKVMNYEIQDEGFLLRQGSSSNTIPIGKKDIDDFIEELKELKEVIV